MPAEWSEESFLKKEMKKWEQPNYIPSEHPFPRMLYKVQRQPIGGRYEVAMQADILSLDKTVILLSAEQFNASCQQNVNNQVELERALAEGWRKSPAEAVAHHEALEDAVAVAAAYRAHEDRKMGEKAKEEAVRVEAATSGHVAEIPEQPKAKRVVSEETKEKQRAAWARRRAQ